MNSGMLLAKLATKAPTLAPKLGRIGLKLQKASPEILFGVGVVAVVGGVVLACRATVRSSDILDDTASKIDLINDVQEEPENNTSKEEATKMKTKVYVETGLELAKLYIPAVTTLGLGVVCFAASHNIQHQRLAGLAAAYKTVESGLKSYRGRVMDELGSDREREIYYNSTKEKMDVIEVDEATGKEKKSKKEVNTIPEDGLNTYSIFFDSTCTQWNRNMDYNLDFLKMQQNYLNDRLHLFGHVFLNEVYDALGAPRTKAGSIVGWLDGGEGDNYVDFGMSDYFYNGAFGRDYVNGSANSILLDFNVDGVIWDKI